MKLSNNRFCEQVICCQVGKSVGIGYRSSKLFDAVSNYPAYIWKGVKVSDESLGILCTILQISLYQITLLTDHNERKRDRRTETRLTRVEKVIQ